MVGSARMISSLWEQHETACIAKRGDARSGGGRPGPEVISSTDNIRQSGTHRQEAPFSVSCCIYDVLESSPPTRSLEIVRFPARTGAICKEHVCRLVMGLFLLIVEHVCEEFRLKED